MQAVHSTKWNQPKQFKMSFIRDFLFANEGNECPQEYLLWAGYAAISLAAGRRYFSDIPHINASCRLYTILVGPSGNRKTVAMEKAKSILQRALGNDVMFNSECESHQRIIQDMSGPDAMRTFINWEGKQDYERPYGLFVSELMNYIKIDPVGFTSFLTDLRDKERYYTYKIKGKDGVGITQTMEFPYFVLCACTAPEWLTSQIKSDEFCGGFGRRTIFVCKSDYVLKKPTINEEQKAAEQRCVERLKEIHARAGVFKLSPEADHWFWQVWYIDPARRKRFKGDKFLEAWGNSDHMQVLTIAMLTCLSEGKWDCVIEKPHLQLAIDLLDEVVKHLPMLTNRMGSSEVVNGQQIIMGLVKSRGGWMFLKDLRLQTLKEFKHPRDQWSTLEFMKTNEQLKWAKKGERDIVMIPEVYQKVEAESMKMTSTPVTTPTNGEVKT
jgi:hypothetical protein